jgi:ERCC4-type nuclease
MFIKLLMKIKIDVRESKLIELCKNYLETFPYFNGIEIILESLPLGDVIITDGLKDIIIVERKSLTDLSASIKDGRYEEQSYRLNGLNHHNHNIIYLIEGDINKLNMFKDRIDKKTLFSAMFSLNFYKGFSVFRSLSIEESAFIICNMAYKLLKSPEKQSFYSVNNNISEDSEQKEYCEVVKKVKKENITSENIGEIMLCQIPGISSITAIAIINKFKNLQNLIIELNKDSNILKDITYTNSKNQTRKISKTVIENIIKYLCSTNSSL